VTKTNQFAAYLGLQRSADAVRKRWLRAGTEAQRATALQDLRPIQTSLTQAQTTLQSHFAAVVHKIEVSSTITVAVIVKRYVPTATVNLPRAGAALVQYTVTQTGAPTGARLRLTSVVEGYSARAVDTVDLAAGSKVVTQHPTFHAGKLKAVTEETSALLRVRVDILDGGAAQIAAEQTYPLTLLARDIAFLASEGFDGTLTLFLDLLGAFVTPSAPAVHQALREAASFHPIRGYDTTDPNVDPQVKAIYRALKGRQLAYVNTVESLGAPAAFAQHVRLPRESLRERSVNCVDASALFASLIEAASIQSALVSLPDHMLVAWRSTESGTWKYLETTCLCIDDDYSFEEAVSLGSAGVADAASSQRLDLAKRRGEGIFPME
jgi:hypothetical protein